MTVKNFVISMGLALKIYAIVLMDIWENYVNKSVIQFWIIQNMEASKLILVHLILIVRQQGMREEMVSVKIVMLDV